MLRIVPFQLLLCCLSFSLVAQTGADPGLLTIDREDLVRYDTKTQVRSLFIASEKLIPPGESIPMAEVGEFAN